MANTANTKATEAPKAGARNFRATADIENFYRFVHENKLRLEAKMILEAVYKALGGGKKKSKKKTKGRKKATKAAKTLH